jgi:hypothetical protein
MAGPITATVRINADKLDTRVGDLEKAVLELASVVERLVVGGKNWKGEERAAMLFAVDNARALATPEDDDPEPEPPATSGDTTSRYWIDLRDGNGYATDDLGRMAADHIAGRVLNCRDRESGTFLVWRGKYEGVYDLATEAA